MGKTIRLIASGIVEVASDPVEDAAKMQEYEDALVEMAAEEYKRLRLAAYTKEFGETWEDTFDYLYRNGLDGYVTKKTEIKTLYPKPALVEIKK